MKYLSEERKTLLFEIDSIMRWDKLNLNWLEMKIWSIIRKIVVFLTNK